MSREARLEAVRAKVAVLEARGGRAGRVAPFGDSRIDRVFPGGGLPLGCWHEAAGEGLEIETAAAAGAFVAALVTPLARRGAVIWVLRRDDLHAPGLFGLGFPTDRLIQVKVRDEAQALGALEDALGSLGVAAAVGESAGADLTAGRRLQLACERHGASGFLIRRQPFGGRVGRGAAEGCAPATRWRIASAPSEPALGEPGLGAPRWCVALERCRGGRTGTWILEKTDKETGDGAHPLRVVAVLGDRQLPTSQPLRLAG